MVRTLAFVSMLLLVAACDGSYDTNDRGFGGGSGDGYEYEPSDENPVETGDDDDAQTGDDDDAQTGDDDDDELPAPDWFVPPTEDGSQITVEILCSFLDGPGTTIWEKQGDEWLPVGGSGSPPNPALESCFLDDSRVKYMEWYDDGTMWMEIAGLGHELEPSTVESVMNGVAYEMEPTDDCRRAIEDAGLPNPIPFTLRFLEVTTPE